MSSELSDLDIDLKVELLKKKYLEKRKRVSDTVKRPLSASVLQTGDNGEKTATRDKVTRKEEEKKSPRYQEMTRYSKALEELLDAVSNQPQNISGSEDELSDQTESFEGTGIQCSDTDVTLPSNVVCTSNSCVTEPLWFGRREGLRDQSERWTGGPAAVRQVYQEMLEIYEKLQAERLSQQAWAAELHEREQVLQQRETRLLQHHSTICRLRGVEGDVIGRVHTLQQQYQKEIETLRTTLKEKSKENGRIKSSFDSIKELNDTMKKKLIDVTEQNQRLQNQSRKVQARLDNLQRKYEYSVVHKRRENIVPKSCEPNATKLDRPLPSNKATKAPSSSTTLKLLAALLDWVVDAQVFIPEEGKEQGKIEKHRDLHPSLHERCSRVLPVLVEHLQQSAKTDPSLLLPLLRFSYYALTQLECSTQHPPLTSTLRRLGEEVSCGLGGRNRSRSHQLFRSSCLHTRFLSSLIILKTLSQVDILAQAIDVLHDDVGTEEGKALFLKYQALAAILALLRAGNPSLLTRALDILLQMGSESRYLPGFLEVCSTERFFCSASLLLRNNRLDLALIEKIVILLQKLSSIRKNRRLFEVFSLHLLLQEMHRSADPGQAFLCMNLSSILLNLDLPTRP